MPKLPAKYEKDKVPATLAEYYTVEKDGFMFAEFDDDVALLTNPALETKNKELLGEKKTVQTKYDDLVKSSADISREVIDLRATIASGGQVSSDELAIVKALKGVSDTPADIKKKLEEYPKLESQLASLAIADENRQIASVMKWKPEVFGDLRKNPEKTKDMKFEMSDVTENGATVKKVFVSYKDASGVDKKDELSEFVKANDSWNAYLPSLAIADQQTTPQWVQQGVPGGTQDKTVNPLDAHIQNRNAAAKAAGNALLPAPPPAAQPQQTT